MILESQSFWLPFLKERAPNGWNSNISPKHGFPKFHYFLSRENSEKSPKIPNCPPSFLEMLDEIMGKHNFPIHQKNPQKNLQVGSQHWYHLGKSKGDPTVPGDGGISRIFPIPNSSMCIYLLIYYKNKPNCKEIYHTLSVMVSYWFFGRFPKKV